MEEGVSISPWSSLVESRFSDNALSRVARGLHLQTMDSELDSLMQAVFQARRMRNKKAGPCTLPAEILAYIFECLQPYWPPLREHFDSEDAGFYSGWMSVTHVCSLWREVALSTPSLWSKPTLDILNLPHQYIPDILFRSQLTLLELKLDWEGDFDFITKDGGLNAWLSPSICRRARRLDIAADMDIVALVAARLPPSQDMAQLRELSVIVHGQDTLDLPVPFYNLSGLTSLSLHGCRAPWLSAVFSSHLTALSLAYNRSEDRPSYSDISTLMALLHSLGTLHWEDIVPISESAGGNVPAITFPKSLRQLTIHVTYEDLALDALNFISHIITPSRCSRNYNIPSLSEQSTSDMALIDNALGRLLPDFSFAQCDDIEERYLDLTISRVRVIGCPIASLQSASPCAQLAQPKSTFVTNGLDIPAFSWGAPPLSLNDYLSLLALEHLHSISLDVQTIRDLAKDNSWPCLLRSSGVHRIGVERPYMNSMYALLVKLLDALGTSYIRDPGDEPHILFPQLEVLALPLFEDEVEHRDLVVSLISLVHARREQRVPLRELVVPLSAASWSVWNTLRSTVRVSFIHYPMFTSPMTPESVP
ncbi:hypothetical protein PENSPDRAFT_754023 [Peniophora sp. CONT]|nr:hypothetical protein PENSPDRAFT_754023 [Peniophora sp. CONT]